MFTGINTGDSVLIHSSLKRTCEKGHTPHEIFNFFIDAVGSEGTLFFPLFNFDFCGGKPFDIRSSPSHMGALTEIARNYKGAVRTGHPVYSFAVIGCKAHLFKNLYNNSGYGQDSPFARLREMNGKIAVLDLPDQNSMTFYHHVEEMHAVPYRFHKDFTADYIDWDGHSSPRTFSIFVRDIDKGVKTDVAGMENLLWEKGRYTGCKPGAGHGLRVISANTLYEEVSNVIRSGNAEGMLFRYG